MSSVLGSLARAVLGAGTISLAVSLAVAQVPTATTVLLRATTGAIQSQVLGVSANGVVTAFSGFPSDALPPLAIEVDPIDRNVLIAVDLGGGTSRVLRLLSGLAGIFTGELVLGDLPGPCTQLMVIGESLLGVVSGTNGGIYRLPRRGGQVVLVYALSQATALHWSGFGDIVILGWSGTNGSTPTAPGLVHIDTLTGLPVLGPFSFSNLVGKRMTGIIDLPAAGSQQLLSFDDGTFVHHTAGLGNPTPVAMVPQPPNGGAVALKQDGFGTNGLGLGGATAPFFYRANSTGAITVLAGPLTGSPVDLAIPLSPFPQVLAFGDSCGTPQLQLVSGVMGPPQVGNLSFDLRVGNALPQQQVLFATGLDDIFGGLLPLPIGNCLLHVELLNIDVLTTNAGGLGIMTIPIPNAAILADIVLFAQWAQLTPNGLSMSQGAAVHIGL